ncbi:MAG: DUF4215 domain-containing protein [Myxococcota bacterium]|nr:DUF4215 domain-containing protein [Myxococcota bacterium]
MRFLGRQMGVYFFLIAVFSAGCFSDVSLKGHGCDKCWPCERCVQTDRGPKCKPIKHFYTQCGAEDSDVHWFNSCNEQEDEVEDCSGDNIICVNLSTLDARCECTNHWEGDDCEDCPGNWDEDEDCNVCENHWIDQGDDCGTCPGNWDEEEDCDECRNNWEGDDCEICPTNWDPTQDCDECQHNWDPDENCEECFTNWDPAQDCAVCKNHWTGPTCEECPGNWDPAQDCNACKNGWTGDNCELCPEGWAADQDCIEVCGNGFTTPNEACDDANEVDWDGCNHLCEITEFQVNTHTTGRQDRAKVTMASDSRFVVAWQSEDQDGTSYGVYGQRYDVNGLATGDEFQVNTYADSLQGYPAVAMASDGRFVVAWQSEDQDGDKYGIFSQRYSADGLAIGDEFKVNTYLSSSQVLPAVAVASDGRFVITWQSLRQDGSGYGVYGQRYNVNGIAVSGEFRVNTYTPSYQNYAAVAMASNGRFVITWCSNGQDGDGSGVYAQRYSADGLVQGNEFQVNTNTTSDQKFPSIAMAQDGRFVVLWQSVGEDGFQWGIFGQRYGSDGTPAGEVFQANTHTTDSQDMPAVAMAADGRFVVAWQSGGQDGDGYGIYAQRYDGDGSPVGDEFQVNTYTTGSQDLPTIAMSPEGRFVIAWSSYEQDGNSDGIFAQRYDADGNPLGSLPWNHYQ